MNLRAPYSPPLPARKARSLKRAAHFRYDNTHPQILWNHRLARAGGGVVVDGNDRGAGAVACEFRAVAGNLLRRGRHWMGAAGDAYHQLDGAAGYVGGAPRVLCTGGNVTPERITRIARSERCRPSQATRGSTCRLVRPSASTMPEIADAALTKPASAAITTCCRRNAARSPNGYAKCLTSR